ncbi:major facilitator superfamily MFS_1 [Paenibacillus curdlanolyticus YK9]|uniref:Major facilitator superfamily MFS_1 n=1 Tax=Paenibacillus curdlanolyticus YK9 TaxID=717606 RepID=E0I4D6_9BACL|nr:MFS transporter [Paenibacillus curdlanolyticus]EFM13150.1 major facilitator superfamily MFS_1 [Paenibacillus curdlanolyticus YK9]
MAADNSSSYGRAHRVRFGIMTVLYWTSMYMYVPILSPYLSSLGYSLAFIGIVLGSYGFVQLLIRFPIGLWSDAKGRRRPFIVLGLVAGAASCILFMIPGWAGWPLAGRITAGLCASSWSAFTVMYASMFPQGETSKAMGQISAMTVAGQLTGMAFSAPLADGFGWNTAFLAGVAAAVIGIPIALTIPEKPAASKRMPKLSFSMFQGVIRQRTLVRASVLSVMAHAMLFISMFGFTPLKAKELGANGWLLTGIVFSFMIPHALASLLAGGVLFNKFGEWRLLRAGFGFGAVTTALVAFSPNLSWLAATQAINGFMQGLLFPLLLSLAIREAPVSERATAMGFYQAVYAMGMFAGPFVAGWMNDQWGINSGFWLGGAVGIVAAGLTYYWSSGKQHRAIEPS